MMRKILYIVALLWLCTSVQAQKIAFPGGKTYLFRVQLKDKKGTKYSLKHPEKFLSERSLKRRERQSLKVDSTDLPLSQKYLDELGAAGFEVVGGSKWNNTALVKLTDSLNVGRLATFPFVTGVRCVFQSPDSISRQRVFTLESDTTAADPKRPYGKATRQIEQLNGRRLHEAGYRGKGMLIGIVDGGYMNADIIPAFKNIKIVGTHDFVYPYQSDLYRLLDHGTMVLSCMAVADSSRYVGTAPEAEYMLLRSEYGPTESLSEEDSWAMAVEYADKEGVDVINSSLGYAQFDDASTNFSYSQLDGKSTLISRTASMLADKGVLLVCSAGNSGDEPWKKITPPGDAENVLTVGAVSARGINTNFSSVGPSQDGRVKPDVMALGGAARVFSGRGLNSTASGTSFASPICCGMVACLWQALPRKTAREIIELVRASGNRVNAPDNVFGYGIPDFWKAYQIGK